MTITVIYAKEVTHHPVCWFVSRQNYSKSHGWILIKFAEGAKLTRRKMLDFGMSYNLLMGKIKSECIKICTRLCKQQADQ